MKRLLAALLLGCTLFTLCACPGGTPSGDGKCPTCGKDPCECNPEGCPVCGQNPCVCPPPAAKPVYAQTYPYTDEDGVLHIRYQDTYTFSKSIVEIKEVKITSTVTGTKQKDANLLVEQKDGRSVYADGCGTATVKLRGNTTIQVRVDPSPINMLFVTGQSNASGDHQGSSHYQQYVNDYIRSPETMAYFTWTGQQMSVNPQKDLEDYTWAWNNGGTLWPNLPPDEIKFTPYQNYVPTTLDWETATCQNGAKPQDLTRPVGESNFAFAGWSAALAYEWIKQTGERVWIVNCAQGGMEIQHFQPNESGEGTNEYYQATAVFNAALETLYKEVDAGHFVLNHMAYYWFHGESNSQNGEMIHGTYKGADNRFKGNRGNRYLTAEEYTEYFIKMHEGFQRDVVYKHNGVEKKLEYCGVMVTRCSDESETKNTFEQVILRGPRASQYYMGASQAEALKNVYLVSNITEQWVGKTYDAASRTNPEADAAVEAYFLKTYGSPANFKKIFGYDMPTTVYEVHPGVHYFMRGHNELGMDCARNSLRIINLTQPENCYKLDNYRIEDEYAIKLIGFDGRTELNSGDTLVFDRSTLQATVCPQITPLYQQVQGIRIEIVSGGFTFDSNVFTANSVGETFLHFKMYVGEELYEEYGFLVTFA